MELVKIEIENYKSITAPVSIAFYKNLPTVLIGKNGSGKSNILEAIEHIILTNSNLPGKYSAQGLKYKAYIRMEIDEFANLFPNEEYSEEKAEFWAYSSEKDSLHLNTIESDTIVPLLRKELDNISELAKQLESAIEDYEKALEKITCDDNVPLSIRGYDIVMKENTTNYNVLKHQAGFIIDQVKRLIGSLAIELKSENAFVFSLPYYSFNSYLPCNELIPFKLKYKEPELALFEQKFITINRSAIKREITKINKKTESACQRVDEILNKLKTQLARFADTDVCSAVTDFVRKVSNIFGNNCGYLLSENSQVLFKDLQKENDNRYYNPSQTIFEAYAKSKKKDTILKDKDYKLTDKEIKEFEEWLNVNRPEFDQGMYKKIHVSANENNQFSIVLCENNGQVVSLNETSAGRRWYFTYYFVKNTLSKGDTFIIDEPASMLHPSAQKEILSDICKMVENGIRVIYSTHSPYLIPDDWNCVGFVSMSDKTEVLYVRTKDEMKPFLKEVLGDDIFDFEDYIMKYTSCPPENIARNISKIIRDTVRERNIKNLQIACDEMKIEYETMASWNKQPCKENGEKNKKYSSPSLEHIIIVLKWSKRQFDDILK